MNIGFFGTHMETLADLIQMAKKHNCKIHFGFDTSSEQEIDADVVEKSGLTPELYEEMKDKMLISDSMSLSERVWFELYDESTGLYNTMSYTENCTYFRVSKDNDDFVTDEEDAPSDELIEWLELNDKLWDIDYYTIHEQHNPTVICGFGNDKCVEDFRCYRNGMALKFFADLVCDYLEEPRIDRVLRGVKTELNAEQIIKALECCKGEDIPCGECIYADFGQCQTYMAGDALALIKELTEENERLRGFNSAKCEDCAGCTAWNCDCANIEADAVRKMQEQLKMEIGRFGREGCSVSKEVIFWFIDQVAKEMLEKETGDDLNTSVT